MMDEVELTQELVRINSENPPGNEREVAKFVHDYLQGIGMQSDIVEVSQSRFDVIAELGKGEGMMFNGHIDTVPVGDANNWKHDPFGGKVVGGKLYGRGSSDMKGGVASIIAAVQKTTKEDLKKRIVLTFVADEEEGQRGSDYIVKNMKGFLHGVRYGVFAESTSMEITYAQKGFAHVKVKFRGKAAHGSTPERGVNAIEKAGRFIGNMQKLKAELRKTRDPDLGSGTINIGRISGGTKVNIVPDYCEVEVDRRLVPGESPKSALAQLRKIAGRSKAGGEVELLNEPRFPMKMDKDSDFIVLLRKLSDGSKLNAATGYMEGELFKTGAGIECVSVGPGLHEQAHVVDEFVPVKNLRAATKLYEGIIRKWCI